MKQVIFYQCAQVILRPSGQQLFLGSISEDLAYGKRYRYIDLNHAYTDSFLVFFE